MISRQSSSSSHCGSVADEPDTRSSPCAGVRYEDTQPDCTSSMTNPIKNNGYERAASGNDEMIERLSNDQGAEGWFDILLYSTTKQEISLISRFQHRL